MKLENRRTTATFTALITEWVINLMDRNGRHFRPDRVEIDWAMVDGRWAVTFAKISGPAVLRDGTLGVSRRFDVWNANRISQAPAFLEAIAEQGPQSASVMATIQEAASCR